MRTTTKPWHQHFIKQGAFPPEEQVSAATNANAPRKPGTLPAGQQPQDAPKQDSIADELPGENEDEQGEFFGQGDMAQNGQKQPIFDFTPCQWMAGKVTDGEIPGEPDQVVQVPSGAVLVSCELCRTCEWEKGCYGFDEDEAEKVEERKTLKMAAMSRNLGVDVAMPELLVAEKVARLKFAREEDADRFLRSRGYTAAGAEYIIRLSKSVEV